MTLNEQLTTDLSIFYDTDEFAQIVTYNATDITALVDPGADPAAGSGRDNPAATRGELSVRASDVAAPAYRDVVVIGSDTWYVRRIISGSVGEWRLEIFRDERPVWA